MSERFLKTQQVADALRLSPSTIKRYVDSGTLRATRTIGRHRLIPVSEAIRLARELGISTTNLEAQLSVIEEPTASPERPSRVCDPAALVNNLRRGRSREVREMLTEAHGALGAVGVADTLLRPAMEQIGTEWSTEAIDVYQEHRASRILEAVLQELIREQPAPAANSPLAMGATPARDHYTISGLLCELTLRELGWDVVNLGPNLPLISLARAIRVQQPRLAWITAHHLDDPKGFVEEYATVYASASAVGCAMVLGGPALGPSLRCQLVATFGDRMCHLREFARQLTPRTDPPSSTGRNPFGGPASTPIDSDPEKD